MKIVTWNVNSIRARLPRVLEFVDDQDPDVLLLQEIKVEEPDFPMMEFNDRGYHGQIYGQKSYNGVCILSKGPVDNIIHGLPNYTDDSARFIQAEFDNLTMASVYAPNGNPVDSDNFAYKKDWLSHFVEYAGQLMAQEKPVLFGGDFNIIPHDYDCHDPDAWDGDAIITPAARHTYHQLEGLGYHNIWRGFHPDDQAFSYWDYQGQAFERNAGCRIDYFLATPEAVDHCSSSKIFKDERGKEKPSDHVPVMVELDF